ncbi:pentatricopeptide repeat-containing protein At2g36980, mitochondrial-like [Magnolia sinica]|uniref:pentatricopeptide repeat-containing protein At2g36980, mitochondrial-like n=1 Tax=Magnolia sinica TaxID=86752 RepID=UPI00265864D8|nr:pentatricopeptide repeat-containing protein At2g36980, mitochondrial-like [Magnolia sinica]
MVEPLEFKAKQMFNEMPHPDLFRTTSNIVSLAQSGMIATARRLFDEMPQRDIITWNAMLTSYSRLGLSQEALSVFSDMRIAGMNPDAFSFTAALHVSADAGSLSRGRKFHALVVSFGFQCFLPVCNSLIDMYGKCSSPSDAYRVFNEMGTRNEVSWCSLMYSYVKRGQFENAHRVFDQMPVQNQVARNILMTGYSQHGEIDSCMHLFKLMQIGGCGGDLWTFAGLMNAYAESSEFSYGRVIHACIVKSGWSSAAEVNNSILSFYAKLGCHEDAVKIFNLIKIKTQVSWNAMIDAHMKNGDVQAALAAFQHATENNVISWTAMIGGYARNGHGELALSFFVNMRRSLLQPDDYTFGAILHACANLAVLGHGKMVHGCVIRFGLHSYMYVGNGLINMYAKCGDMEGCNRAFGDILRKDLVSWNAMLFGFGLHGRAHEALRLFEDMVASGVEPDKVTFIGLLTVCSHSGLVEQGRVLFESMESVYGLAHEVDHVACMIDMLGRGGYLEEASKLVEDSSAMLGVNTNYYETLLGACSVHGDVRLGKKVGEDLMAMEPLKEMGYVLLSNLYCASGQWKEAERVRKAMSAKGVKKVPGYSWIEVRNNVMVFVAGDLSHPMMDAMYMILESLESEMRNPTFHGFDVEL